MIDRWGINLCGDLLLPSSLNLDERNLLNIMLWTGEYSNQNVERNFFSISKNSRLKNFRLILRSSFIWREEIKILLGRSILAIFSVPLSYIFFFNIIFRLMYFFFSSFFLFFKISGIPLNSFGFFEICEYSVGFLGPSGILPNVSSSLEIYWIRGSLLFFATLRGFFKFEF